MSKWKRNVLIAIGVIALLVFFSIVILPVIVRNKTVEAIQEATGRKVEIAKVAINPFTLSMTMRGFAIDGKGGGPFASIGEVRGTFSLSSIYKRALILSRISVDKPSISIIRLASGTYNFSDILERLAARKKEPGRRSLGISLNNLSLINGSVDFDDRAVNGGRKHTIRDLNIAIPFISTIPYLAETYIDPHISAVVNGAPFTFSGKTKPFSKSLETAVRIEFKQLDVPRLMAYVPFKPAVELTSGTLTIDTEVSYVVSSDQKPHLGIKGVIRADGVNIKQKDGKPLLNFSALFVKASDLELFTRRYVFDSIAVDGLELFASRDNKGEWMYSRLLPKSSGGVPKAKSTTAKKAEGNNDGQPLIQIASLSLTDGIVHFTDAVPAEGFKGEASQVDLTVKNFSTAPQASAANYELSLLFDNEATLNSDGTISPTTMAVAASAELSDFKLRHGWPYLSKWLTSPLKGTLDCASKFTYTKQNGFASEQGEFVFHDLAAQYGDKDGLSLPRLTLKQVGYRQKANTLYVAEILIPRGNLSFSREKDGTMSYKSLLKKETAHPVALTASGEAPSKVASGKLQYSVKKLQIDKLAVKLTDKTFEEKPRFNLRDTSLTLSDVKGPNFTPAAVNFFSVLNKETPIRAKGTLVLSPFQYKGGISTIRLPLRDFEAYFPSNINVFVLSGLADTNMDVDISLKNGKLSGSFKGNAGVRSFHAIDSVAEEDLLKWESLQMDEIQGTLNPFAISLRQIAVNGVYSHVVVHKDGTLNLQHLVEKKKQESRKQEPAPVAAKEPAPSAPPATTAPVPNKVQIGAVTVQDGTLSFVDNHLSQQFATTFYNLGGSVSGLSSEESKFAEVDLRGNLENQSPLQITGQINPLRSDLYVNLKISFHDIDLSPVTPYSGTYLGYAVEKGKLYLDLKYHIEKKQLNSENKVFIDQFTLGKKIDSPKATKLPVKLGIAMLKDRKGEIHLDVPVTGRTDAPSFSIWKHVFQAFKNVIVKAVTSPLKLLSSMFGGGKDFSVITFDPGSSLLLPEGDQKLNALSKALLNRPALKVELRGYVDRERDREGYRREMLNRKVKNEKFLSLSKEGKLHTGETAENIKVLPDEFPKYLANVYKKEKFPKPRNFLGLVKDLPPDEMRKLILANTAVTERDLQTLARNRVETVVNYLLKKGIPLERMFQKSVDIFKAPEEEGTPRSRVELDASAQ